MKGRAGIITALLAALLAAAYTLVLPMIHPPTPTPPPPPATSTVPDTHDPPRPEPDEPADTAPEPTAPASSERAAAPQVGQATVAKFTESFAAAFARPEPGDEEDWRRAVAVYLDLDMQQTVSRIGPQLIPYQRVTGPATVEGERWPYLATVPTDTGALSVTVCPDTSGEPGVDERMTICGIDLGGHP